MLWVSICWPVGILTDQKHGVGPADTRNMVKLYETCILNISLAHVLYEDFFLWQKTEAIIQSTAQNMNSWGWDDA